MGWGSIYMVESFWFSAFLGSILGFLAGLGVGGGSLLLLWLTAVLDMDAGTARSINLLFFLPASIISILFRHKQGKIPFRKIYPAILAGCIGAGSCSYLRFYIQTDMLKKLFGYLLLATGLRELFYHKKTATN